MSLFDWKAEQRRRFRIMAELNPHLWEIQKRFDLRLDLEKYNNQQ